jgi:hypothetical protein
VAALKAFKQFSGRDALSSWGKVGKGTADVDGRGDLIVAAVQAPTSLSVIPRTAAACPAWLLWKG